MATSKNITRRAFVNAAATTAAGVSALTVNAASAARPSKLTEVTAAFEVARKAFMDAIDVEQEATAKLTMVEREPILSPKIGNACVEYRGRDAVEAFETVEKAIRSHASGLRRQLQLIGADPSPVDAWEARTMNEATSQLAVWQARRDDCGYTAAEADLMRSMDAENDALLDVLTYRPVSPDDARAKAQWICERLARHEISGLHCAFECLLESTLPEGEELHEQGNGSWVIVNVGEAA